MKEINCTAAARFMGLRPSSFMRSMNRRGFYPVKNGKDYWITTERFMEFMEWFTPKNAMASVQRSYLMERIEMGDTTWVNPYEWPTPEGVNEDEDGDEVEDPAPVQEPPAPKPAPVQSTAPPPAPKTAEEIILHGSYKLLTNSWFLFVITLLAILLQAFAFKSALLMLCQQNGVYIDPRAAFLWGFIFEVMGLLVAANMSLKRKVDDAPVVSIYLFVFFASQLAMDLAFFRVLPVWVMALPVAYSMPVTILAASHIYLNNVARLRHEN